MIIWLPLLVCLIGLLLYGFAPNPKLETIGLHMFWVGLLATLLPLGLSHSIKIP